MNQYAREGTPSSIPEWRTSAVSESSLGKGGKAGKGWDYGSQGKGILVRPVAPAVYVDPRQACYTCLAMGWDANHDFRHCYYNMAAKNARDVALQQTKGGKGTKGFAPPAQGYAPMPPR